MKSNISSTDRIVRLGIAALAAILYFANVITGTLGITLLVIGVVLAVTSFINFCPLYFLFGISTNKPKKQLS